MMTSIGWASWRKSAREIGQTDFFPIVPPCLGSLIVASLQSAVEHLANLPQDAADAVGVVGIVQMHVIDYERKSEAPLAGRSQISRERFAGEHGPAIHEVVDVVGAGLGAHLGARGTLGADRL